MHSQCLPAPLCSAAVSQPAQAVPKGLRLPGEGGRPQHPPCQRPRAFSGGEKLVVIRSNSEIILNDAKAKLKPSEGIPNQLKIPFLWGSAVNVPRATHQWGFWRGQPAGPLRGARRAPAPCLSPASAFIDLPCLPGCIHADNQIALLPSSFYLKYH